MVKKSDKAAGKKKKAAAPKDGNTEKKGRFPFFARFPRWMWLVGVFLVILLVGTMLAFLLFSKEEEPEPVVAVAIPEIPLLIPGLWQLSIMKIPLRVEGEIRLPLHLGIAILAADPGGTIALLQNQEAIVAAVHSHMEKGRAEDWESIAGKLQLKYDLVNLVNGITEGAPVQSLYITDYMILWPT